MLETRQECLVRGGGGIDSAVRNTRCDGKSSSLSLQPALECIHVGWIGRHQIRNAAGQDIAEDAEARADHRSGSDLPGESAARLPLNCGSCGK